MTRAKAERPSIIRKKKIVKELAKLLEEYGDVFLVAFERYPANKLAEIRKKIRGRAKLKFGKLRLMQRAIDEVASKRPELQKLKPYLDGKTIAFLLIKPGENSLEIVREVYKEAVHLPAKGEMIAPNDIVVPAMKTNLRVSGQITMELQGIGLPTKVEKGFITIPKETVVVKKGERIPEAVARVLNMLGLKPIESRPEIIVGIFQGLLVPGEIIVEFDPERVTEIAQKAIQEAINFAFNAGIITPKTLQVSIPLAISRASVLAAELGIPTSESLRILIPKAVAVAKALKEAANIEE